MQRRCVVGPRGRPGGSCPQGLLAESSHLHWVAHLYWIAHLHLCKSVPALGCLPVSENLNLHWIAHLHPCKFTPASDCSPVSPEIRTCTGLLAGVSENGHLHRVAHLRLCDHILIRFQVDGEGLTHLSHPVEDHFDFHDVLGLSLRKLKLCRGTTTEQSVTTNTRSLCCPPPTAKNTRHNVDQPTSASLKKVQCRVLKSRLFLLHALRSNISYSTPFYLGENLASLLGTPLSPNPRPSESKGHRPGSKCHRFCFSAGD